MKGSRAFALVLGSAIAMVDAGGCALNPATGRLQFSLLGENDEIELGAANDREIVAVLGLYEDVDLARWVAGIGGALAAKSERPHLPWTFRVLDDPAVNAFALPGGYVYVTRGLLAFVRSESELAAVLSHEIAHVTARHGASQYSRARVAARSVGVFRVIDPGMQHVGAVAAGSAHLSLLRHSREHEIEADGLALRYLDRSNYPRDALRSVLAMLARIHEGGSRNVPSWLSTHPEPETRIARLQPVPSTSSREGRGVDPEAYLARIDGILFGVDPRAGFVRQSTFFLPRANCRVDLPPQWKSAAGDGSALATSPDGRALMLVTETDADTIDDAAGRLLAIEGLRAGEHWKGEVRGRPVLSLGFAMEANGRPVGLALFVDHDGTILMMIGIAPGEVWPGHADIIGKSFDSLRRIDDPALLDIEPMRIAVTRIHGPTSIAVLHRRHDVPIGIHTLALINGVEPDTVLPAGEAVKLVRGGITTPLHDR